MKRHITSLLVLTSCYLFASCSSVASSMHYTNGTDCLARGDYNGAINELEQAVQQDPTMARNHTNLSAAYMGQENYDKVWYHARQAVRCPYDDGICQRQFRSLCKVFIFDSGINTPGTKWENIEASLGTPDVLEMDDNQQIIWCVYGNYKMTFSNGQLTKSDFES